MKLLEHTPINIHQLSDHLFRHESGKMVSVLTKVFGTENLETAEDVVQQTFIDAMQVWKLKGIPDNPSAWLFRVAKKKLLISSAETNIRFNMISATTIKSCLPLNIH
ncbi:MAG: sigma factor [Bacteroidia bacterium]